MNRADLLSQPHRRYNPLNDTWVLVSPQRTARPWQGQLEADADVLTKEYDPACYLCPGNTRARQIQNPDYRGCFVFENDFPALLPLAEKRMFMQYETTFCRWRPANGICKVISFSPAHNLTLATLQEEQIAALIAVWISEYNTLRNLSWIRYIQIFENKGAMMGCSNQHPHGQLWAGDFIPTEIRREDQQQRLYFNQYQRTLLSDYILRELDAEERVVCKNDHFLVLVPFWAEWPFETMVLPLEAAPDFTVMSEAQQKSFAAILKELAIRYDALFGISFPYSAGIHTAPVNRGEMPWWHWHMHFYPPLLRNAVVKKFKVGYEMLAESQRDIMPEWAAQKLRDIPIEKPSERTASYIP